MQSLRGPPVPRPRHHICLASCRSSHPPAPVSSRAAALLRRAPLGTGSPRRVPPQRVPNKSIFRIDNANHSLRFIIANRSIIFVRTSIITTITSAFDVTAHTTATITHTSTLTPLLHQHLPPSPLLPASLAHLSQRLLTPKRRPADGRGG